ncbi:MAG: Gfo/Idh/MocA family oxidoreductase [Clostridia bacterium]|nr:Gfo/Idh/MocA family oxidoreductase [Clostridia bacterium]
MSKKVKLGFIGHGLRGYHLIKLCAKMADVDLVAVCDMHPDRAEAMGKIVEDITGKKPYVCTNHKDMIKDAGLDAVILCTSWSSHIPLSIDFMNAGIAVGCEVGGCDSLEQIWELVRCHRRTGTEFMMLENCCYGRQEMMVLNMVKKGIFGEVVHCDGGYVHNLCGEILAGKEKKHYRLRNYMYRNCDNYPTHALGPIAKILGINNGNRFLTLTSTASKAAGLNAYMEDNEIENKSLIGETFNQGDVVVTNIKCANGETICLKLATTTPIFGTRNFNVFGTKGFFTQPTQTMALISDGIDFENEPAKNHWNSVEKYYEEYDHPIWKEYNAAGVGSGHGGMDHLVFRAFIESVKNGTKPPIDVYDAAAWMCISPLSEMSIAMGSAPVAIPDFTYGQWIEPDTEFRGKYSLNTVENMPDIKIYPEK